MYVFLVPSSAFEARLVGKYKFILALPKSPPCHYLSLPGRFFFLCVNGALVVLLIYPVTLNSGKRPFIPSTGANTASGCLRGLFPIISGLAFERPDHGRAKAETSV